MKNCIAEGRCSCGKTVYRTHREPLIVHACHCRHCQRQTGASHALNALLEHDQVKLLSGEVISTKVDTPSGAGQSIIRCGQCLSALWSHYHKFAGDRGHLVSFIRVGTLNQAIEYAPDVHIYAKSRLPYLPLAPDIPQFDEFYNIKSLWPERSLVRLKSLLSAATDSVADR